MRSMDATSIVAAQVWHYWMAIPLFAGALLAVLAVVALYLKNVEAPKYPRNRR